MKYHNIIPKFSKGTAAGGGGIDIIKNQNNIPIGIWFDYNASNSEKIVLFKLNKTIKKTGADPYDDMYLYGKVYTLKKDENVADCFSKIESIGHITSSGTIPSGLSEAINYFLFGKERIFNKDIKLVESALLNLSY